MSSHYVIFTFLLDRRRRKRRNLQNFSLCDASSSGKFSECRHNVKFRCQVAASTCVYVVSCQRATNGYDCGIPLHSYSDIICCTPYC